MDFGVNLGRFGEGFGGQVGAKLAYLSGLILSYLTLSYLISPYLILSYLGYLGYLVHNRVADGRGLGPRYPR